MSATELLELERALTTPLDLDWEAWKAARKRFIYDAARRAVVPVHRDPYRATVQTAIFGERIYSSTTPGAAKNTFTSEAVINDTATMGGQPDIEPGTVPSQIGRGATFRVVARGIYSTTGAPTWVLGCRLGAQGAVTGPLVGATASTAWGSGQTNLGWEFEFDFVFETTASGAASTVRGLGMCTVALTTATSFSLTVFGGAGQPGTVTNVDIKADNFVNITATCGTSSASNSIQLLHLLFFGW